MVLGEYASFEAQMDILRPEVGVIENGTVVETIDSDVPDHIMLQGILTSGAPMSVNFRRGQPFKGDAGFTWNIIGEKGEIKVTNSGPTLQVSDADVKIQVYGFASDEVEDVSWENPFAHLPMQARNVASLYEAFASGGQVPYPGFGDAVLRHKQLEAVFKSSEQGEKGSSYI